VNVHALIRVFVAICMIAGLMAGSSSIARSSFDQNTAGMSVAAGDMHCRPTKPSREDCPKCPLMALCAAQVVKPTSDIAIAKPISIAIRRAAPSNEPERASRDAAPLSPPPRSMV
jgi:hypothetical protein